MLRPTLCALTALLVATMPAQPVAAGAARARPAPIKDCTRFNGRSGYYGNLWCTEREQLIWDRYTSTPRTSRK